MQIIINKIKEQAISIIITLQAALAIILSLSALKVGYYQTIHRTTVKVAFTIKYDFTIWIIALTLLTAIYLAWKKEFHVLLLTASISILAYFLKSFRASVIVAALTLSVLTAVRMKKIEDCAFWALTFWTGLEVVALLHWGILKPTLNVDALQTLASLEHKIFGVTAIPALPIALLILFIWILKPIAKQYVQSIRDVVQLIRGEIEEQVRSSAPLKIGWKPILALAFIFSIVTAIYTYLPSINPYDVVVGVDARHYVKYTKQLNEDLSYAFKGYLRGSRPLMLLLIFGISKLTGLSIATTVKYMPLLIHPILTMSAFIMVLKAVGDKEWAALSALLTAAGIMTVSDMYAYILANTLAIAVLYISVGYLIAALKTRSIKEAIIASIVGTLAVVIHPWAFTQYYASIALMAVIMPIEHILTKKRVDKKFMIVAQIMLIAFLAITGLFSLFKAQIVGGIESIYLIREIADWIIKKTPATIHLINFWHESIMAFMIYYGGSLSNTILMGLALTGAYNLNREDMFQKFLITLIAASSIAYLIVYDHSKVRIILGIPVGVLAAKGLLEIMRSEEISKKTKIAALIFTVTFMTTYTLRSLANLV